MKTSNYPSWLVSVEQAKKLKELGFDIECALFYDDILKEISFDEEYVSLINWNQKNFTKCISLPAWEKVLEWFRRKNLIGWVECQCNPEMEYYTRILKNGENYYIKGKRKPYSSYEEARNVLIDELIIIYKEFYEKK